MSFIGLKNPDGKWLDLGNTEIEFEIENPVFKFDIIPAEKSYAFNLPKSKHNLKCLNFPNRIANTENFNRRLEGYELWLGGVLYAKGSLYVIESLKNTIEVSFQTGVARIAKWFDHSLDGFNLGGGFTLPSLVSPSSGIDFLNNYMVNRSSGAGPQDFVFAPYHNDNQSIYEIVNNFNPVNTGFDIDTSNFKITPQFYLRFILLELEYFTEMEHQGDFMTDDELGKLVFFSPIVCNDVNFTASRFLPPISIRDFYKELGKTFCFSYHFSRIDNTIQLKYFKDIYNSTSYKDYTSIASPNHDSTFLEIKGSRLVTNTDGGDSKVINDAYEFYQGIEKYYEIEGNISYPKNKDFTVNFTNPPASDTYRVPSIEQSWDFPLNGSKPGFDMRLLFYRGYQVGNHGGGYPYLSHDDKAWNNVTIPNTDYTLDWEGTKGRHNKFFKEFTSFIGNTRLEKFDVRFTLDHILNFDFAETIRIKSNEFLADKLKFKVTRNGIENSRLELYRK